MAKKAKTPEEQPDTDDELLDFDLEELTEADASVEEDVIDLVDLVEIDEGETKAMSVQSRGKERPAGEQAEASEEVPLDEAETYVLEKGAPLEEETDLDLSDLSLDMDAEAGGSEKPAGNEEISDADLEDLLQEASDDEISLGLSTDEGEVQEGKEGEAVDSDLEGLFLESTEEGIEGDVDAEGGADRVSMSGAKPEEIQAEKEKPSPVEVDLAEGGLEETQALMEAVEESKAPSPVPEGDKETLVPEEPVQGETAAGDLGLQALAGLSEERLEQIITKVVQDVVERVARETMASVAERVLGQAIEALKASLEGPADES